MSDGEQASRAGLDARLTQALHQLSEMLGRAARPLPDTFFAQFSHLLERVRRWDGIHGLTARLDFDALVDVYLADAWMLAQLTSEAEGHWLDVGSGGGAPGLVLALLLPNARITLVEPRRKRVAFLRTAIGEMGLSDRAQVLACRSSELDECSCDVAVSRATLTPHAWLMQGCRLAQKQVWVHLSAKPEEALSQPGWGLTTEQHYRWPFGSQARILVAYAPVAACPA